MKVLVVVLTAPVMLVFALAGIQTLEWCLDNGTEIPWQVFVLLICVSVWCIAAIQVSREDWHRADRFFRRQTGDTNDIQPEEHPANAEMTSEEKAEQEGRSAV